MPKKPLHLMSRSELLIRFDNTRSKVNKFMETMSYHERINNPIFNRYVKKLDALAKRIEELSKQNEKNTRITQ